ncbi:hypothetical protein EC991_004017 [Linnemannia zychae]|nr:hypothetical protein EC991_004017 [Linnemannia zychae]
MLSALSPSSIANAANNNHPSVDAAAPSIKSSSAVMDSNINSNNNNRSKSPYNESGGSGVIRASPGMDYSSESASSSAGPVHPLSTSNSSSPSFSSRPLPQHQQPHHHYQQQQQHHHHRSQTPTSVSTPTFQHQQLVKIKSEHGVTTPHPPQQQQQMNAPDIIMTDEDADADDGETAGRDSEQTARSPMLLNSETMDEDEDSESNSNGREPRHSSGSGQEKTPLMVDTSSGAINTHHANNNPRGGAHMSMASPNMTATPSTATLMTPDSGTTNSSSRRPSLRTMTATLPRSALQEETIALFKQYRNLIPCAKCFSRNTIQRDGMSDGNLRFKCRPPVSMSLICNKSYSESKIRNMIAGVVYGHNLPETGTPTSATSSENVLALALPPSLKSGSSSGRRASQKYTDLSMTPDHQQPRTFQESQSQDHKGDEYQEHGRPQHQQHGGGYEEMGDDRHPGSRRPSSAMPSHPRRPSLIGQESPMMDYEESAMMGPPASHLQVPNTPPLDGEDPRMYRPHSAYGHRPLTPVGAPPSASSNSTSAPRQGAPKLHHSHSHPNIGQQRHQQYHEQQRHIQQQQQQQPRQVVRIEPAPAHHGHGSDFSRSEMAERRFSHPAALQRSPSNKYLPVASNSAALSPAMTSPSSQSSPRYESVQAPPSSAGPGGRYEETHGQASYYQRRMSQPHPSSQQRSYGQLPPPPPPTGSTHRYDRRASEVEEYNYQHLRQYERLNASTMRGGHLLKSKVSPKQYSPPLSSVQHSDSPLSTQQRDGPTAPSSSAAYAGKPGYLPSSSPLLDSNGQGLRTPQSEPMRFSHSMPSIEAPSSAAANTASGGRHAYQTPRQQASSSSVYYRQPSSRDDLEIRDSYAHESSRGELSPEDVDGRPYARMRQGFRKTGLGQSIRRLGSSPNLYTAANGGSMTATSSSPSFSAKDLNSVLPRNAIKLTCFPSAVTAEHSQVAAGAAPAAKEDDLDMKMSQSSRVVIEITQPRSTFDRSSTISGFDDVPRPLLLSAASSSGPRRALRHAVSQPNLLVRNSSSVLERRRRSVSPPGRSDVDGGEDGFGSSKKRRADSLSRDEDVVVMATTPSSSSSVAEAAAAAVVAAAANAARQSNSSSAAGGSVQIIGHDYSKKEVVGLGVVMDDDQVNDSTCSSPMIDALDVARASSYVSLEDQKELGIDYSLFTRVETAAWRILIPPNVTASFRSEDFGLTLKPKAISDAASLASPVTTSGGCAEITPLVAPMAAISTNEIEEEEEERDMIENAEHEGVAGAEKEGEGDQRMDVVMEIEEEEKMTTTTTTTVTTTAMTAEADAAALDAREEEVMMNHQLEDD